MNVPSKVIIRKRGTVMKSSVSSQRGGGRIGLDPQIVLLNFFLCCLFTS